MRYRNRLHVKELPGKPDIVMIGRRKIIDVRGFFWYGYRDRRYGKLPKSRVDFWTANIERNRHRDAENLRCLEGKGWRVMVVWQCALKDLLSLESRLREFIEAG